MGHDDVGIESCRYGAYIFFYPFPDFIGQSTSPALHIHTCAIISVKAKTFLLDHGEFMKDC